MSASAPADGAERFGGGVCDDDEEEKDEEVEQEREGEEGGLDGREKEEG